MTKTVVLAEVAGSSLLPSPQFIVVPFKLPSTGLMSKMETSGSSLNPEDLLNVNVVESITRVSAIIVVVVMVLLRRIVIPDAEIFSNLQIKNDTVPLVIVHITSSLSPTWQSSALGEGDIMAAPANEVLN